ncbi:MAG: FtsQ-type POTRA domain-containing protein [Spirochaetaceae bacterium]|nr:MAG: FtsQ-type POTRA domain-containing protein [Spirochaetaceae bacterium]
MADAVLGTRRSHRRGRSTRSRRTRSLRGRPLLTGVVVVLGTLLVGELLFHMVLRDRMVIRRIAVESNLNFSSSELLEIAGIGTTEYFFGLDTEFVRRNLEQYPAVRAATVKRVFPDTLRITLEARKPLAVTFARVDGRSVPVVFDEHGVVFQVGSSVNDWDLPVVAGLQLESVRPGVQLPPMLHGFLADLKQLQLASPALFRQISEYRIVRRGEQEFEVVLYPVSYPVPVRVGVGLDETLFKYIVMVLDVFQREGKLSSLAELDFRAGEVVYRLRED